MEDEYVIGIRLALENGVSAGLASIRADLTTLDRAIAGTSDSLRQLTQLAATAHAAAGQPPRPAEPPSQPAATPLDTPAPTAIRLTAPPASTEPTGQGIPQRPPDPAAPATPPRPQPSPSAASPPAQAVAPVPPPIPFQPAPTTSPPAAAAPPRAAQPLATPPPSRPPTQAAPQSPLSTYAPSAPATSAPTPMAPPPPPLSGPTGPAAPHAATTPQQTTGGDVFLDGDRLGHWLANHLAREASRPQSSSTGFDPTLSITWPGAQQGG